MSFENHNAVSQIQDLIILLNQIIQNEGIIIQREKKNGAMIVRVLRNPAVVSMKNFSHIMKAIKILGLEKNQSIRMIFGSIESKIENAIIRQRQKESQNVAVIKNEAPDNKKKPNLGKIFAKEEYVPNLSHYIMQEKIKAKEDADVKKLNILSKSIEGKSKAKNEKIIIEEVVKNLSQQNIVLENSFMQFLSLIWNEKKESKLEKI